MNGYERVGVRVPQVGLHLAGDLAERVREICVSAAMTTDTTDTTNVGR